MKFYGIVVFICCCVQFCWADGLTQSITTLTQTLDDLTTALKTPRTKKSSDTGKKSESTGKKVMTTLQLKKQTPVKSTAPYEYSETYDLTNGKTIRLEVQDITKMTNVQAIVNAANAGLHAGGGVCGAIYGAAGSSELTQIVDDWKKKNNKPNGINVGEAALTGVPFGKVNKLPENIEYIVHAVGPNCTTSEKTNWKQLLKDAYTNSLLEAAKKNIKSVAFPSISTAIFGCNPDEAAPIAIQSVLAYLEKNPKTSIEKVIFVFWPNSNGAAEQAVDDYATILDDTFKK